MGVIFDLDKTSFLGRHVLFWERRGVHLRLESSCIQVSMVYVNVRKIRFRVIMVTLSRLVPVTY